LEATQLIILILREGSPAPPVPQAITEELEADILRFLKLNRLVSLFYDKIKENQAFSVLFRQQLKGASRDEILRLMQQEAVFRQCIALLKEHEVQPVVIKGFSLAATLYRQPHHRPMADIDLLVRPGEFDKASGILTAQGAKMMPATGAESATEISFDRTFILKGVKIELHHHLMNPGFKNSIARETIFDNTCEQQIMGMHLLVLAPEMQLFYLLHHLSRHWDFRLARFIWVMDIHYFVNHHREKLNMLLFLEFVASAGNDQSIFRGLYLCAHLFGDKLPEGVPVCKNAETLVNTYLEFCRQGKTSAGNIGSIKMIRQIKGWRNKVKFAKEKLYPSAEYLQHRFKLTDTKGLWKYRFLLIWMRGREFVKGRRNEGNEKE
jgi:hypothetical protein